MDFIHPEFLQLSDRSDLLYTDRLLALPDTRQLHPSPFKLLHYSAS